MTNIEKRTVSLPAERDAAVERWLRDEVAPVYDAMRASPNRAFSLDDVFADIRSRQAKRLTNDAR